MFNGIRHYEFLFAGQVSNYGKEKQPMTLGFRFVVREVCLMNKKNFANFTHEKNSNFSFVWFYNGGSVTDMQIDRIVLSEDI